MEVRYLTITMEQVDLDNLRTLAKRFDIRVTLINDFFFALNPKMKYQDWKLTGELEEIEKFFQQMKDDDLMKISRISQWRT